MMYWPFTALCDRCPEYTRALDLFAIPFCSVDIKCVVVTTLGHDS